MSPPRSATTAPPFATAFQPIVDAGRRVVVAYEALVRGPGGEGARFVLDRIAPADRYRFDHACRARAIARASDLGLACGLTLNVQPNALLWEGDDLPGLARVSRAAGIPPGRIVLEVTEDERMTDLRRAAAVVRECQRAGLRVALDDFGAGYSGLQLLAELQPDVVKLDMTLCRAIDTCRVRPALVHGMVVACTDLGIEVVAEGVETRDEFDALRALGVRYFQGYLFAHPAIGRLPTATLPQGGEGQEMTCDEPAGGVWAG